MRCLVLAVLILAAAVPALAQTTCFEENFNTSNGGMYGFSDVRDNKDTVN
jgi:urea transporter